MTVDIQRENVRLACDRLAPIPEQHELIISHGNGPQIGLLALEEAAYADVPDSPLDVLGAETQGMIGYLIEQELGNRLPFEKPLASLLTRGRGRSRLRQGHGKARGDRRAVRH